jgi:hypothetical protein
MDDVEVAALDLVSRRRRGGQGEEEGEQDRSHGHSS